VDQLVANAEHCLGQLQMKAKEMGIDELVASTEQCLAELRTLSRRNKARRAVVQARYADLGRQIRQKHA
jgi:hypothetical protein